MTVSVGFIGLGDIGEPIAGRILAAGFRLSIWNRTPRKMQSLLDRGAIAAETPADLARRCDIVCTCVTDAGALEAVVFGPNGISSAERRAGLLLDNSTVHPLFTREVAKRLRDETGMSWLDVPVSGGSVGARAGTLAAMVGGEAQELERARPVIMSYANRLTHMGPVGSGHHALDRRVVCDACEDNVNASRKVTGCDRNPGAAPLQLKRAFTVPVVNRQVVAG